MCVFVHRLHNLVTSRQQDKANLASLERKLTEERKQRLSAEQQAVTSEKRKKAAEESSANATKAASLASAARWGLGLFQNFTETVNWIYEITLVLFWCIWWKLKQFIDWNVQMYSLNMDKGGQLSIELWPKPAKIEMSQWKLWLVL